MAGPLTPRLVDDLVHLGTWMPFLVAARNLGRFHGVAVAEASARRWTEKAGAALVAQEVAEVERVIREEVPPAQGPPLQQVSVDGALVPLVGGGWTEVKTLAIGTVGERVWEKDRFAVHTADISYFSRCTDHLTFSHLASGETHRRGTATAGEVLGIVDGAEWEQSFLDDHRKDAVRILDWGHAAEHFALAGQALFGAGTAALSAWLETWLGELRHGDPEKVLTELRERIAAFRGGDEPRAEAQRHRAYLEARRNQIRYAEFEARGYPIGSGMVESGNKLVVEARLKGAGMHWAPDHINPLVALRAAACSDRWDEVWPAIHARLRQAARNDRRQRHAARRATRGVALAPPAPVALAAPSAPSVIPPQPVRSEARPGALIAASAPRRPPADHPWRRPLNLNPRATLNRACPPARTET